ncbi:protein GLUTAMINE DUMPER 2-like [Cynara cardunculus var. scolymus]|uniref:protein GLUTAMINE DUMPER 2-like n=1 Tax=Cynara cardunculus var. scolymus TaxID=59895 RepID=UPI000D624977|nr:protein GLUTAMINE DUMPER 2-like [Cynara cardunculus var. scolymus]
MALQSTSLMAPASPVVSVSPWHSPVPYLFGSLAAMMALIALALFILACSYRKLSRNLTNNNDAGAGDAKPADNNNNNKTPPVLEEKYLVIMAGQQKPTFLARPTFCSSCRCSSPTTLEMAKEGSSEQVQVSIVVS